MTLNYVSPGEVFGVLAVFSGDGWENFAQAVSPRPCPGLPGPVFRRLLDFASTKPGRLPARSSGQRI
jgi:hypothetical protein